MQKPVILQNKKLLKKIEIKYDKDISPEYIQHLFLSVGWQFRECSEIKKSTERSFLIASAWLGETLVGLARATGDGVSCVTIWDFVVKPSYQKKGIGKLLLNSMMTKLYDYDIPLITLYSESDKKKFYDKVGFVSDSEKITGMYKYNLK